MIKSPTWYIYASIEKKDCCEGFQTDTSFIISYFLTKWKR